MIQRAPIHKQDDNAIDLLLQLEQSGLIKQIQNDYLYWDKIKYRSGDYTPKELWNAVKFHRYLKSDKLQFGNHTFTFIITDYMQRVLHQFDTSNGGTTASSIGVGEMDKVKFITATLLEEAISSCEVDGMSVARKVAKAVIHGEQKPTDRSEQLILNTFNAMKYIFQEKNEDLTPEKILDLYQLLSANPIAADHEETSFRTTNELHLLAKGNNEVTHTPPPANELTKLIKNVCVFFNKDTDDFIHPMIKGGIIHYMVGWMDLFTEHNGRVARALFYWYMLKKGYWLTEFLSISTIIKETKGLYEKAYLHSETDENDLGYFLTYHIKTMEKAYEALKQHVDHKQKEMFQATRFMKIPFVNDRMAQILRTVNDDPERMLSVREIELRYTVSNFTARSDLRTLVEMSFLEVVQVNKKKQIFIKSKTFDEVLGDYDV